MLTNILLFLCVLFMAFVCVTFVLGFIKGVMGVNLAFRKNGVALAGTEKEKIDPDTGLPAHLFEMKKYEKPVHIPSYLKAFNPNPKK